MFTLPTGPDVLDFDNPEWSRQLLLHLRNNIPLIAHDQMANVSRAFINRQLGQPLPACGPTAATALEDLRTNGFCRLGSILTSSHIGEIHDYFARLPLTNAWAPDAPSFQRAQAPASVNVADYGAEAIAKAPHLRDLTLGPDVSPVVSHYLGVPPTISYLMSWWSFHGRAEARDAQLFHVDSHDFKWVKLFVYLTDVDGSAGPHVVVRGSHDHVKRNERLKALAQHRPDAAQALRTALSYRQRFEDDHVEALYGAENIVSIEGRAGEAFLVDTCALHKGLPPDTKDRLIFQALYTLMPTIKNPVSPVSIAGAYQGHARAAAEAPVSREFWRYCNRLILRDPEIDRD